MPIHTPLNRRQFLRRLAFAAPPSATLETKAAHTLVVIFLRGGADTLNMLIPYGEDAYYKQRPTLAIAAPSKTAAHPDAAIALTDFYGLHPKMQPLLPAYREGRLAIVQSVGSDNTTGSHFSAQDQIEHGEQNEMTPARADTSGGAGASGGASGGGGGGWLGRHLRSRSVAIGTPLSAVAIGSALPESLRGAPAVSVFTTLEELQINIPREDPAAVAAALGKLYNAEVGILAQRGRETLDLLRRMETLRAQPYLPTHAANYPDHPFARGLREVARLIKADLGLEVACLDLGGWDTHFVQGGVAGLQADLIATLSDSLAAFDTDLSDRRTQVTTLVMTEFGRRLYENASLGTDHGRAFSMFLLGGQIHGGQILGPWPGFEQRGFTDADMPGPGGLKVTIDYRTILAEILSTACGNLAIDQVFPGLPHSSLGVMRRASVTPHTL